MLENDDDDHYHHYIMIIDVTKSVFLLIKECGEKRLNIGTLLKHLHKSFPIIQLIFILSLFSFLF